MASESRASSLPRIRSADTRSGFARSAWVWLGLVAFLAIVELFIVFVGAGLENDPRATLFSWPALAVIGVVGLAGVWLSHRTGFPAAWDPAVPLRWRIGYPSLIGIALGIFLAVADSLVHWTTTFAETSGLPSFNAPFPGSLLFYPGGAIIVEVVYRLLPIPLLMWLTGFALRGRGREMIFWILAVLTSVIEPASQDLPSLRAGTELAVALNFAPDYLLNFVQAVFFRRSGFLSAIIVRVAFYLVWHVAYGNFICRC